MHAFACVVLAALSRRRVLACAAHHSISGRLTLPFELSLLLSRVTASIKVLAAAETRCPLPRYLEHPFELPLRSGVCRTSVTLRAEAFGLCTAGGHPLPSLATLAFQGGLPVRAIAGWSIQCVDIPGVIFSMRGGRVVRRISAVCAISVCQLMVHFLKSRIR